MTTPSLRPASADLLWSADRLQIAGWNRASTVDWPGRTALTVLTQGCPWECTNCETPAMRNPMVPGIVPWAAVRDVIAASRDTLEGVVFAGSEPTRQDGLADAIEQVKSMGLPVALHSAGSYPRRLAAVVSLVDRLVLEIKAPALRYRAVTGVGASASKAFASLRTALDSGVELQVRTCVDPAVLTPADVEALRENVAAMGVTDHVVVEVPAGFTDLFA